jgi:murein DD-endopeptidase MepM/ murein hydrolase activator NlpD
MRAEYKQQQLTGGFFDMEEKKNETKKRFTLKNKKMRVAGAIYLALAICVVTVMVLSIYSINSELGDISEDINLSVPDVSIPENEFPDGDKSDIPTGNEQSGIPAETKTLYTMPVVGEIIKGYSMTVLVYSTTMKDYRTHSGIDIAGKLGDAVKCYTDGYVTAIKDDPFMGKTIEITHDYGLKSVYQNLATDLPDNIKVGAAVKSGDVIGAIGETAIIEAADNPHIHFELVLDGENIDCEKELESITE